MKVLALDIGRIIGYAWNGPGVIVSGHWVLGPEGPLAWPERAGTLLRKLTDLVINVGPDVVVFEMPFVRGKHATRNLLGLAGIIAAVAHTECVTVTDVDVSSIKKFACGFGNASKDDMILAAQGLGYVGDNEHEADAYCLLRYFEKHGTEELA